MQDRSSENHNAPRKQEETIATLRINDVQSVKRRTGDFIRCIIEVDAFSRYNIMS